MQKPLLQNKYLQPLGSPIDNSDPQQKNVPWQWGVIQPLQVKKIRASAAYFAPQVGGTLFSFAINHKTMTSQGTQAGSVIGIGTTSWQGTFSQREYIALIEAGASGGAPTSFFTSSSTPQGLDTSRVGFNPDNYPLTKFYLEAIYRAGTTGESARTFFMDIYDINGGTALANGTISGTNQSGTGYGIYPRLTGTVDFRSSMISGTRDYMLRYWGTSASGTTFVDLYAARIIIDF